MLRPKKQMQRCARYVVHCLHLHPNAPDNKPHGENVSAGTLYLSSNHLVASSLPSELALHLARSAAAHQT